MDNPRELPLVLHLDDSEDDRLIVARTHRRHAPPSRLVQFTSLTEVENAITAGLRPQVALLDARIRYMGDGLELVAWLKREVPTCATFVLSGSLGPKMESLAAQAGADGCYLKSVDWDAMEETLIGLFIRTLPAAEPPKDSSDLP
ncbi:MAG: response regulator [Fimbriimonas sp.]